MAQGVADIEHLVIDNCSTDDTLATIAACGSPFVRVVQASDRGIYDAFNKGLALATGDLIAFLNSDDYYLPDALKSVDADFTRAPETSCVHGQIEVTRHGQTGVVLPPAGRLSFGGRRVFHPTFFARRGVYDTVGGFDLAFPIADDLDWPFRASAHYHFHYLAQPLTHFALGGISTKRRWRSTRDVVAILRRHHQPAATVAAVWLTENLRSTAALARQQLLGRR